MNEDLKKEFQREFECIARRTGRCAIIEQSLGWKLQVPLNDCNYCYNNGGIHNTSYHQYYKVTLINNLKKQDLSQYNIPVILTILGKHFNKEEIKERLPKLAPILTEKYAIPLAQKVGIEEEIQESLNKLTDKEKFELAHKNLKWTSEVAQSFDEAEEVENWNIFIKGWYFFTTILGPKVTDEQDLIDRNESCFGSSSFEKTSNIEPCPALKQSQFGGYYCGDCGCGDRKRTDLKKKLLYKKLRCPRKKKGFYNYIPLTIKGS